MRTLRPIVLALALAPLSVALSPAAARADSADAEARVVARRLGAEAVALYEKNQYAEALEKLETADKLVPTPTLGLFAARCLVKLGRLVEASERYLEVSRMKLDRTAPAVMRKALVEAVDEREKLLPRIPTLIVKLEGPRGDGASVLIDDKPLLPALLGEKRLVDPGTHKLVAKRADTEVRAEVTVPEGQARTSVLLLPDLPAPPLPPVATTPTLRYVGWGALGVGVIGVGVGAIAGFAAISKGSNLLAECPNHVCPDAATLARASGYDTARAISTAGFIAGAAGLAAGIPLIVFVPRTVYVKQERPAPPVLSADVSIHPGGASASLLF